MISFVLPVYNCYPAFEASLPSFIRVMEELGHRYEVIVVDDCSREGAPFRLMAEKFGCIYLRNERNRGKGYSVRRGFARAVGEIQVFMDGDFPFELEVVKRVIDAFGDGEADSRGGADGAGEADGGGKEKVDLVIGDRTLGASVYPKKMPVMRKIGSKILSFFAGNFFYAGVLRYAMRREGAQKARCRRNISQDEDQWFFIRYGDAVYRDKLEIPDRAGAGHCEEATVLPCQGTEAWTGNDSQSCQYIPEPGQREVSEMNRKITNTIRFVLDELIPPIIRDSYWFMYPIFYIVYKGRILSGK